MKRFPTALALIFLGAVCLALLLLWLGYVAIVRHMG
jgi:hypothetical protein